MRESNNSKRNSKQQKGPETGRLELPSYDGPMPLGRGVGVPLTSRTFVTRDAGDVSRTTPYQNPQIVLEPYILRMFMGIIDDPITEEPKAHTFGSYRAMETFYPKLQELLKSNIHSSITLDISRAEKYFHRVAKVYATLETIKSIANLSDPNRFPWNALPPFVSEMPKPVRELQADFRATQIDLTNFWAPVTRHLSNFVLPPSVQNLISYKACPFFLTEGSDVIVLPTMTFWPDLPDENSFAVDLRDHLLEELDELLTGDYAAIHSYLKLFTDWRARVDMYEMNFVGYSPARDLGFRNSSHNNINDFMSAGSTDPGDARRTLVVRSDINRDSFFIQSPTGEFSVQAAMLTKVTIDPDGLDLIDLFDSMVHSPAPFKPLELWVLSDDGNDIIYESYDSGTYPRFEADGTFSDQLSSQIYIDPVLNQRFPTYEKLGVYNTDTSAYESYAPRNGMCDGETVDVLIQTDAYIDMMKAAYDSILDVNYLNGLLGLTAGNAIRTPSSPVMNLLGR